MAVDSMATSSRKCFEWVRNQENCRRMRMSDLLTIPELRVQLLSANFICWLNGIADSYFPIKFWPIVRCTQYFILLSVHYLSELIKSSTQNSLLNPPHLLSPNYITLWISSDVGIWQGRKAVENCSD